MVTFCSPLNHFYSRNSLFNGNNNNNHNNNNNNNNNNNKNNNNNVIEDSTNVKSSQLLWLCFAATVKIHSNGGSDSIDDEINESTNLNGKQLINQVTRNRVNVEEMRKKLVQARRELWLINKELRESYANYDYLEVITGWTINLNPLVYLPCNLFFLFFSFLPTDRIRKVASTGIENGRSTQS